MTASGTRPRFPAPVAATPSSRTPHRVSPETAAVRPVPRPDAAAERRASPVSSASAARTRSRPASTAPNACSSAEPFSRSVTAAPSSPRAGAARRAARRADRGHGQRHQHPGGQQAGREHPGRGRQDQQHRGGRARPDQGGGQRRGDAADEQVLGGVHVADQPGEHVAGAEGGQARRGQPFQLAVHRYPDVGQDPEGHVVGEQPLQVAQHAAADAERADQDHRDRDGHDVRVLGGAGQQEARGRQQGHAGPAAARAGQHGEQQLAAHRPREPEQAEQRMTARGGGDGGHEVTASTT